MIHLLQQHLLVLPIVLPLVSAALLLLLGDRRKRLKSLINVAASLLGLVVATAILWRVDAGGGPAEIGVYLASNWEAPFGIVLVADRLSAMLLVVVGVVGSCATLYAEAAWARAGVYFRPLLQVQLMGLNGAFLTGDLFNLFVFFEVLLAASYGLQLHGSGGPRVRAGLHYIAVNLLASSLFLVGLAVLYGVLGTLSMADVAAKLPLVPPGDRGLLHAGAAILAVAFLIKAAIWPLNAWLVPAYTSSSAPVAALFAVMTKVGVYALMRLWMLFFAGESSAPFDLGQPILVYGGLATLALGAFGLMASTRLGRIAAFSIVVSAGTLLTALGMGAVAVTSAALFYLLSATVAVSALFLLVELIERINPNKRPALREVDFSPGEDTNLDDEELPLVGRAIPVSLALLALAFLACTVLVAGLPPLSGFVAKFSLLRAVLGADLSPVAWTFFGLLLAAGLAATVALARAGIRHFWSGGTSIPQVKAAEAVAVVVAIAWCVGLAVWAEPVARYTNAAAAGLHEPGPYVEAVRAAKAIPGPTARARAEVAP